MNEFVCFCWYWIFLKIKWMESREGRKDIRRQEREWRKEEREGGRKEISSLSTYDIWASQLSIYLLSLEKCQSQTDFPIPQPLPYSFPWFTSAIFFSFQEMQTHVNIIPQRASLGKQISGFVQDRLYRITQWRWILSFGFGELSLLFFFLINAVVKK